MLHLVDSNKAGRNFAHEPGVNWKALFHASEDSFTSSIFGLLFYLPTKVFWGIILDALYDCPLLPDQGRMISYEFWPGWRNSRGSRCEPDAFVRFEGFDLIIEAKRSDHNQQSSFQWENELDAYFLSVEGNKRVFILAIGGIWDQDRMTSFIGDNARGALVLKCRWTALMQSVSRYKLLIDFPEADDNIAAQINIMRDLLLAFRIHGIQTGELFDSMPQDLSFLNPIDYTALESLLSLTDIPGIYGMDKYYFNIQHL